MRRGSVFVILAALACAVPASAGDMTLDQVLERHFEAIGGVEAWKGIESARIEGKMVMGGGQMEAPFSMVFERPGKSRMEFTLQGMTAIQATDGETYWMVMPFMGKTEPERMADDQAKQFARQAEFESELIDWKGKGHQVELVGLTEVEGTPAYELKITREDGDVNHTFLDAEYFLPIRVEATADVQGMPMEVVTTVGDYKEVDGLMMAHSYESRPKGAPAAANTVVFDTVEIGVDVDDALFDMPASKGDGTGEAKE